MMELSVGTAPTALEAAALRLLDYSMVRSGAPATVSPELLAPMALVVEVVVPVPVGKVRVLVVKITLVDLVVAVVPVDVLEMVVWLDTEVDLHLPYLSIAQPA